jgi:hypothetical protein
VEKSRPSFETGNEILKAALEEVLTVAVFG